MRSSCAAFKQANYFIAFAILTSALEDKSFNLPWTPIVHHILSYLYLGLLIMCFILSLGNRPQGSKWVYAGAFVGFAIITVYMTVGGVSLFLWFLTHKLTPTLVLRLWFWSRLGSCVHPRG